MNIIARTWLLSAMIVIATAISSSILFGQEYEELEDNPAARENYELQMLRNPQTGSIPPGMRARELAFSATLPVRQTSLFSKGSSPGIQVQNWTHRGPENVGGRTRALAIDIANENNLLAGGVSGGMWRSIDGGQSWVRTTKSDQLPSVTCIAQDRRPGKTNTWYYGTGERIGNSAIAGVFGNVGPYYGDGIFKSVDNGMNWEQLPATASHTPQAFTPLSTIWRIVTDPAHFSQDIVYAAAIGGVYRSADGGNSWQLVLGSQTPGEMSDATDIAVTSDGTLYATMSQTADETFNTAEKYGAYRSSDGIHWTKLQMPLSSLFGRVVQAIAPSNEHTIYYMVRIPGQNTDRSALFKYTYLSGDGSGAGGKWEDRTAFIPGVKGVFGGYNAQTGYNMVLRVDPSNENSVYMGGTNVHHSPNGFSSAPATTWIGGYNPDYVQSGSALGLEWRIMMYPNHHSDVHEILILPSNHNVVFTATDGGIHKTLNAAASKVEWQSLNNGYLTTQFYAIAINQAKSGDQTVIGGMQDNQSYGAPDAATPWKWLAGGDGGYCAIPDDNSVFYVSSQNGRVCRTKVNGAFDAIQLEEVNPSFSFGFLFIAPFLLDPNNSNRMYMLSAKSVLRNNNMSTVSPTTVKNSWVSLVTPALSSGNEILTALAVSKQPADIVYCATNEAKIFRVEHAADASPLIEEISGSNFPSDGYVQCIAVDPADANHLIAVFANYEVQSLFETKNAGGVWTNISGSLEEHPDGSGAGPSCRWAEIAHHNGQTLCLVGTSTGLYSTTKLNGNQTQWQQEGATSIGNVVVPIIRVRQSDGFVAVGTHGNGVFTTSIVTDVEEGGASAQTFYLEESYPNPSGNSTTVRFALPKSSKAMLRLYDALGHVVRILVDARMESGYHTVEIETKGLPSGRYFLHLESDSQSQTRLVTVVH